MNKKLIKKLIKKVSIFHIKNINPANVNTPDKNYN